MAVRGRQGTRRGVRRPLRLAHPSAGAPSPVPHLFVSDLHLGRPGADDRADVAALVALLDASPDATALVIVGDLFDAWIEHRHFVPRPPARLLGALAAWTDAGRRLVVHAGNHDPWHRSYFADELGATVLADGAVETVAPGRRLFVHHGDGRTPGRLYRRLRPVLRHPLPVALYRTLLPADAGLALARRVAARIRHDAPVEADDAILGRAAEAYLAGAKAAGAPVSGVVFGHSHVAALRAVAGGLYANAGAWHRTRTFLRADEAGMTLAAWTDRGVAVQAALGWSVDAAVKTPPDPAGA